ncbi:hypothetical protein D7X33_00725 [Butyricicoccus sp. 1XD8-22]|nr:hypothetical protein D7X33_00725 [Butyricicoccus sp. 1XD8-22]
MTIDNALHLDMEGAAHALSQAEPATAPENPHEYLMKHLIEPILRGNEVLVGDLDFSAFDEIDVTKAADWCEHLEQLFVAADRLHKRLDGLSPSARKTAFF